MDSPRVSTVARLTVKDLPSFAATGVPSDSSATSTPAAPQTAPSTSSSGSEPDPCPGTSGTLRVPALLALPAGRLLLVHDHRPAPRATDWTSGGGALPDDLPNPNTLWLRFSDDAGATWSAPRRLVPGLGRAGEAGSPVAAGPRVEQEPGLGAGPRAESLTCGEVQAADTHDVPPYLRVTGVSDPSLLLGQDGSVHLFAAASTDVGLFGAHAPTRPARRDQLPEPGTLRLLHAVSRDGAETWSWEDLTDLFLPARAGDPAAANLAPGDAADGDVSPEGSGAVGFPVSGHGTSVGGRLVQPVVLALAPRPDGSRPVRAQALVSDDAGATWRLASPIPAPACESAASLAGGAATSGVDEWAVAGLPGTQTLVVSARDGGYGGSRLVCRSEDGGRTWSVPRPEPGLPDPGCNGGLVAVPASDEGALVGDEASTLLVCSHAADPRERRHGRLTVSRDGGRSWEVLAEVTGPDEPFAYSDLAWVPASGRTDVAGAGVSVGGEPGVDRRVRCHGGEDPDGSTPSGAPTVRDRGLGAGDAGGAGGLLVVVAEDPEVGLLVRRLWW